MELAIIGLGTIGTSIGLALKSLSDEIKITGHDRDGGRLRRARQLKAIDQSHWNLPAACAKAEIILFDLPLREIEPTLAALREATQPGALIMDTAPLKRPVIEAFERLALPGAHLVGGHLVSPKLVPQAEPSAELLKEAIFYLVAGRNTPEDAVNKATNLALALGARPLFLDAEEHDGLMAATLQLPLAVALALAETLRAQQGGRERAAAKGPALAALESLLGESPPSLAPLLLTNTAHLVRWLDGAIVELRELRELVAQPESEAEIEKRLAACQAWLASGQSTTEPVAAETSGGWRHLLLGGSGRHPRP
jgi:prephenate dehydrogenase